MVDKFYSEELIKFVFDKLNASKINYILLRNIDYELPSRLLIGKDIDLLVEYKDRIDIRLKLHTLGFEKIKHPHWNDTYLYNVTPFEFFKNKDGVILDLSYELACRSLNNGEWIPLHSRIQKLAKTKKKFVLDGVKAWRLAPEIELINLLTRCVFDKRFFSVEYIKQLNLLLDNINLIDIESELELIFFKYTPRLIDLLMERKFYCIFENYISFCDY